MRAPLILVLGLVLSACAGTGPTQAQKEGQGITEALSASRRQGEECADRIEQSASYQRVSRHFMLGRPTPAILADTSKPTEADVSALMEVHKSLTDCRTQELVNLNKAHSGFVAVTAKTFADADIDFGRLVRREISWGQYGQLTLERSQRHADRWRTVNQAIGSDLRSQHASEVQERLNANRAMAAWASAQRTALPTLPTYTQCMYVVAGITCTTF